VGGTGTPSVKVNIRINQFHHPSLNSTRLQRRVEMENSADYKIFSAEPSRRSWPSIHEREKVGWSGVQSHPPPVLENALFPQIRMVRVRLYNGLPVVWRTDPTTAPPSDDGTLQGAIIEIAAWWGSVSHSGYNISSENSQPRRVNYVTERCSGSVRQIENGIVSDWTGWKRVRVGKTRVML